MKAKSRISKGFTLIELLVVIAIIGLLAAIIIPSLTASLRAARRARAMSQIQDLDGAIKRFIAEYGIPPRPRGIEIGSTNLLLSADQQAQVIQILMNLDDWDVEKRNTRQIVFLDIDPASFGVKTVVEMQAALLNTGYPDPWGMPYGILLDMDMDDKITNTGYGGAPDEIRAKVGVFSYGESKDTSTYDPPYKTW